MSIPFDLHSTAFCLLVVRALLFFSLAISSFQNLYNAAHYSSRGLLAWKFLKYAYQRKFFESRIFDILYSNPGFIALNIARIVLALVGAASLALPEVLTAIFLLQLALYIRGFLVMSAADQLNTIALLFLLVSAWLPSDTIQTLCLCAMAIQTLFCYFANGLIKLFAHRWLDGSHLKAILSTENFSRKPLARKLGTLNLRPFKLLSRTVITWELTAILIPFLPQPLVWVYLGIGLCFHAVIATVMGLNTFFWTFVSTYPAIIFLQYEVTKLCQ